MKWETHVGLQRSWCCYSVCDDIEQSSLTLSKSNFIFWLLDKNLSFITTMLPLPFKRGLIRSQKFSIFLFILHSNYFNGVGQKSMWEHRPIQNGLFGQPSNSVLLYIGLPR